MFQRILLAWQHDQPPQQSLELARSLADAFDAELTVCCLGDGAVEAQAAVGAEAEVASLPATDGDRELLRFAHEHAFDLLVVGRVRENVPFPRKLIESASLPVLVVAEESAR